MTKCKFKKIKKVISLMFSVVFLASAPMLEVSAAEQSTSATEEVEIMKCQVGEVPEGYFDYLQKARAVLSDCMISVGFGSDGMEIEIFTGTSDRVPVIGIKDIRVEQKVWYGWKLVAVSTGAETTDADGIGVSLLFEGAIKDETYRVTCVHYADLVYDDVEEYTEGSSNTGAFVFTY